MEEKEAKHLLLALVEANRNSPIDSIPADVKGWRFPSGNSPDVAQAGNEDEGVVEQYQQPVCFWTGVTCDPIDGSITGLNLGNGFYAQTLLGISDDGVHGGMRQTTRALSTQLDLEITLHKERHHTQPYDRRAADVEITLHKERHHTQPYDRRAADVSPCIPSSLGELHSLRFINLSSNQLQGPIPQSVLGLPNLEIVDLSSNDLEGTFPHFESPQLRVLDISKNRFHGPLDDDLFGHPSIGPHTAPYLHSLVKFDVSHNGFNGTIPLDGTSGFYNPDVEHEESMQNLQYFDLGYNLFSGTICNNFGNFENLQGLFLEHNRLVGTIPKSLFRGSGIGAHPLPLTQLFLQQNLLSGTLNEGLATLPNLKEIYVDGNKLTGSVPQPLCNAELNGSFLNNTEAAKGCDGISCPANSASKEGVAPCTPCPDDVGFRRYLGQHDTDCRGAMSETEILDLFFERTHGDEWTNSSYWWEKGSPACERAGVVCNARGQVTKIILPSLGLRGQIAEEIGFLRQLRVLSLEDNDLMGFLPSALRFAPLRHLDIHGSRIEGVVPPMLCIKEGVNGNGIGPPGVDFNLLYSCANIACPRGTYSSLGRAALPEIEGEYGVQCLPCFDDQAALYMGRDACTDISIAGLQIRRDDMRSGLVKMALIIGLLASFSYMILRWRKSTLCPAPRNDRDRNGMESPQRQNTPVLQRWVSSPAAEDDDGYSDDDWTAAYSEAEDARPISETLELTRSSSRLPDVI